MPEKPFKPLMVEIEKVLKYLEKGDCEQKALTDLATTLRKLYREYYDCCCMAGTVVQPDQPKPRA